MNPDNRDMDSPEHLSEWLGRLRDRPIEGPPEGYFDSLEHTVFDAMKKGKVIVVDRPTWTIWLRAAVAALLVSALAWYFIDHTTPAPEMEWVFTEEELHDFLEQHYEELDESTIYAAAQNEKDLYLRLDELVVEQDAIDFIINGDESLELFINEDQ